MAALIFFLEVVWLLHFMHKDSLGCLLRYTLRLLLHLLLMLLLLLLSDNIAQISGRQFRCLGPSVHSLRLVSAMLAR